MTIRSRPVRGRPRRSVRSTPERVPPRHVAGSGPRCPAAPSGSRRRTCPTRNRPGSGRPSLRPRRPWRERRRCRCVRSGPSRRPAGDEIGGGQGTGQSGDGFDGAANDDRLAVRHAALETPGVVRGRDHVPAASRPSITSMTAEPNRRVCSNPSPNSTPFTMGMLITAPARAASSRRSHWTWLPSPIGTPVATISTTPPAVSPALRASSMRAIIRSSAAASGQRSGLASVSSRERCGGRDRWPRRHFRRVRPDVDPEPGENARATEPAATRAAVSRAEARSRMFRTSSKPYFGGSGQVRVAGPEIRDRRGLLVSRPRPWPAVRPPARR
jgi:hypothetical protein